MVLTQSSSARAVMSAFLSPSKSLCAVPSSTVSAAALLELEPALFAAALRILGVPAGRAAVIGDNPETDGVGAGRLGMHFVDIRNWAAAEAEDAARLSCAAHDGAAMLEVLQ